MPSTMISRIDGLTTSVAVKAPIKIMTSAPITLYGEQTINAVTPDGSPVSSVVLDGDRVGVNGQVDQKENGIYVVRTTAWTRAKDFDGSLDAVLGTLVTDSIPLIWRLTTPLPVLFGTSNIVFETEDGFNQGNMLDLQNSTDPLLGGALVGRGTEAVDSIKALLGCPTGGARHISVASYHAGWASTTAGPLGRSVWAWDSTEPKENHNGFDKISPTVPWNGSYATMNAFQAGTGEAAPGTNGCWVRIHGENDIVSWGCLPAPGVNNFSALSRAIAWAYTNKRELKANSGTFEYGTTLDLSYPTLVLRGDGFRNTVFKFTGSGRAMDAIGTRPNNGIYSFDLDLSDFTIEGNASATDLLRVRINHARIRRINAREASTTTGCAFRIEGVVAGYFETLTMSTNTQLMTSRPANGIVFNSDPSMSNQRPTCNTLVTPCIEGAIADGMALLACDQLVTVGGTSENNGGNGLTESAGCQMNTYTGFDCEHNLGYADIFIGGQNSTLNNCGSTRYAYIDNSARGTKLNGGWYDKVETGAGAVGVDIFDIKTRFFGGAVGLVTNNNAFLSTKRVFDVAANAYVSYAKPATGITLTASPMTYTNPNITDETILISGGTVTQVAYLRLGTPYLLNPATGCIRLQPGDGVTISYTGTPVITRIPGGSNNQ